MVHNERRYDYDLMSGKVRQVHYRPEQNDAYHQRYSYDHDGRIISCETSRDGIVWVRDASYAYELHGPLRRIEIGQDSVQGIDYTYTINGWLKSINHPSSEPTMDAGRDGKPGTAEPHALFGRDAFGMMLTYHTDDFKHTGSFADAATTTAGNNTWHQTPLSSLYNGNIAAWSWSSRTNTGTPQPLASRYRYDVLNRIRVDTLSTRASTAWQATPNYRSSYTYDGNGNLKNLVRVDSAGTLMDSLVYRYQVNRNRLTHVDDPGGVAGNHIFDVDDQQADNYTYDATGNLTSDVQEGITSIEWTPSNKIRSITKGSTSKLEYTYDGAGNRVVKRFYQPATTLKHTTWYARDAHGNVLSIYERPHADSAIKQTEVHIYGSSRLGIEQRNITYSTSPFAWLESEQHRHAGTKRYELADHLGNVRVTISDLLVPRPASTFGYATQDAEVIDRRDYYPFGMEMPGRRWRAATEGAGRFGFNGKENDDEVKGEGNQQDYGFRIYDPRVARFLSVDPLAHKLPSWTPYSFCFNNSLMFIDPTGAIPYPITIRAFAPFASFGLGFHGDDRGYTTSSTATARVHQRIKFDTDKTSIKTDAWSSPTSHILIPWSMTETPSARVTDGLKITQSGDAKTFEFGTHVAGSNPMVPGAPLIDVFSNFSITENRKAGTLDISGTLKGDNFPSTEAFITDPKGNNVFIGIGFYEGGPFTSLDGENKRDISRFKFSISTDDKGNFTGVKMGERAFSIGDWNKQFEKSDPHKNEEK